MFWKQRDSFREKETRQQEMSAIGESYVKSIKETVLVGLPPQQKTEIEKLIEKDFSIYERLLKELEDYNVDKYIKVLNDSIEEWRKIILSQSDSRNKWKETYLEKERKDVILNNLIKTIDKEKSGEVDGSPKNKFEREIEELHYKLLDNRNRLIEIRSKKKDLNDKVFSTILSCWQMTILSVEREIDSVIRKKQFYQFALLSIQISTAILLAVLTFYNITLLPIAIVFVIISYLVGRRVKPWLEKQFKLKLSKIFLRILGEKIITKLVFFIPRKKILDELSLSHEDTYEHGTNKVS